MLDMVASYHRMQFQGTLLRQARDFGPLCPNSGPSIFFQKSDFYQLSSCTISEKTNDPILRKLSDRRTDRWTDRRTDVQD